MDSKRNKIEAYWLVGAGARFIIPVAALVNIFQQGSGSSSVEERRQVAAGEYNKAIEAKISAIESTCNV